MLNIKTWLILTTLAGGPLASQESHNLFQERLIAKVPKGLKAKEDKGGFPAYLVIGDRWNLVQPPKGTKLDEIGRQPGRFRRAFVVFSGDGKVAYGARKGNQLWWKVMDASPVRFEVHALR